MQSSYSAFFLVITLLFSGPATGQCSWTESTPAPTERFEAASCLIDDRLYVFGGWESGLTASLRVDALDPVTETWDSVSTMPIAVTHMMANRYGRQVWFVGGFIGDHPGTATDQVWMFDIDAGTWTPGPSLPAPRASGYSAAIGRKLHYSGGLYPDRSTPSFDHWVLDLENLAAGWDTAAAPVEGLNHGSSLAIGGKFYTFGGQYGHDGPVDDVRPYTDVYDPATDSWTRLADGLVNRSHQEPSTFFVDGQVYVGGGRAGATIYGDMDAYHLDSDSWTDYCGLTSLWLAPAMRAIGTDLIQSQGGQWGSGVIRDGVRMSPFNPSPDRRLRFLADTLRIEVAAGGTAGFEELLWSTGRWTSFSISTSASWLSATTLFSEVNHSGVDVYADVDASGLASGTYYATIDASATGYTGGSVVIELEVTGAACDLAPADPGSTITGSTVTLNWGAVPGAIGYQLQGGPMGGIARAGKVDSTSFTISLAADTYVWRVRAKCAPGVFTPRTAPDTFSVLTARLEAPQLEVFPNPAQGQLCPAVPHESWTGSACWIAADGRTVLESRIVDGACISTPESPGLYLLRLQDGTSRRILVLGR